MGFEPTRSKTLRPERNPLDHSGKRTGSPLSKPHITKNTPATGFQTQNNKQQTTSNQQPTTFNANTLPHRLHTRPRSTRHHSPILTSYTIACAMRFSFLLPPDILYQPANRPRSTMSSMAVLQTIYGLSARHFPSQIVSQIDPICSATTKTHAHEWRASCLL